MQAPGMQNSAESVDPELIRQVSPMCGSLRTLWHFTMDEARLPAEKEDDQSVLACSAGTPKEESRAHMYL
ncbi:hypothetical protein PGT21_020090 [Puccinia graminis f. sp. tritici]|uniref:Uncharacterized protein n=1 Tax=Puccinia graminis f. sp. tritici TaxID=56615 RepID=A0A5B0P1G8_PUCGR|nr:hypothetical protein PGTUg99_031253 [Puccinia graminis f. sp. tritici]KAA1099771.1 hypothetical protein PGT21_020090 [Puccinia graminis f. sp. tritici]